MALPSPYLIHPAHLQEVTRSSDNNPVTNASCICDAAQYTQQQLVLQASDDQESTALSACSSTADPQGSAAPASKVTNMPRARHKVTRKRSVAKSADVNDSLHPEAQDRSDTGICFWCVEKNWYLMW